jgi:hypothetical protein
MFLLILAGCRVFRPASSLVKANVSGMARVDLADPVRRRG